MYIASPKLNLFASESALQIQLFDTMAGITIFVQNVILILCRKIANSSMFNLEAAQKSTEVNR